MSVGSANVEGFEKVIKLGTFFYPASKHYDRNVSVRCDRCFKTDLLSCVGFEQLDLCLVCVDSVSKILDNKKAPVRVVTRMMQSMVVPDFDSDLDTMTKMMQSMVVPNENFGERTRMFQSAINPGNNIGRMKQRMKLETETAQSSRKQADSAKVDEIFGNNTTLHF